MDGAAGVGDRERVVLLDGDDDGEGAARYVRPGPHLLAEPLEDRPVADDDEVPGLTVLAAGGQATGLGHAPDDIVGDPLVLVFADGQDGPHGIEDWVGHGENLTWTRPAGSASCRARRRRSRRPM